MDVKTIKTFFLLLLVSLILTRCSRDNGGSFDLETINIDIPQDTIPQDTNIAQDTIIQDVDIPMEPLADIGAVAILGFPKTLKKFENGILKYWAQYYYRPDGNLLKVDYGYGGPEIFNDNYEYNSKGQMVRLVRSWGEIRDFYWDNGRIITSNNYNGAWWGRFNISYDYNDQGQIIQQLMVFPDYDIPSSQKSNYSYYEDGNLRLIEESWDLDQSGVFKLERTTTFEGYNEDDNLFSELEIIPGQIVQHKFPTAMTFKFLRNSDDDKYEVYDYEYDTEGRVIAKIYGKNKVTYDYY